MSWRYDKLEPFLSKNDEILEKGKHKMVINRILQLKGAEES